MFYKKICLFPCCLWLLYFSDIVECKKRLQLPQMKESSLSAEDDKVGTETENEFEERIQPTSLIGTDI